MNYELNKIYRSKQGELIRTDLSPVVLDPENPDDTNFRFVTVIAEASDQPPGYTLFANGPWIETPKSNFHNVDAAYGLVEVDLEKEFADAKAAANANG